jgi:hypothetical protein
MQSKILLITTAAAAILAGTSVALSQGNQGEARPDAIAEAQTPKEAPMERPEQKKTAHDLSDVFNPSNAVPSSEALTNQQDRGESWNSNSLPRKSTIWLSSCGSCRCASALLLFTALGSWRSIQHPQKSLCRAAGVALAMGHHVELAFGQAKVDLL